MSDSVGVLLGFNQRSYAGEERLRTINDPDLSLGDLGCSLCYYGLDVFLWVIVSKN